MRRGLTAAWFAAALLLPSRALAFESAISGFGTLGYALSDRPYAYQRFVDRDGTFKRDTVLGVQWDAKLGAGLSLTMQGKVAASGDSDSAVGATVSWGFLSYRPNNDWLLRVGKFRVPLYLHSETQDVGTTFDQATLPVEVYSQSPTTDFNGLAASRSWNTSDGDIVLDAYWGRARSNIRIWFRDDLMPYRPAGPQFLPIRLGIRGLAMTVRRGEDVVRAGYIRARVDSLTPLMFAERLPFIPINDPPGVGYYDTEPNDVTGGPPFRRTITVPVYMLGFDIGGPFGARVTAEFGRRVVKETVAYDTKGAYLSLRRRFGAWTPYLSYALLQSTRGQRAQYRAVNENRVPDVVPDAAFINLLQRSGADSSPTFDQKAVSVGLSYVLSPTSRLKAELQRVRIGEVSALVDAPPGSDIRQQSIRLLSISYSAVF